MRLAVLLYPSALEQNIHGIIKEGVCEFSVDHMARAAHIMVAVSKALPDMWPKPARP